MGKAAMCIRMLQVLNKGGVFKISELADILETNPRNILEYKKELEECGYYLLTITGRNGGYQLDRTNLFPTIKLTGDEMKSFDSGINYLLSRNDFLNKNEFSSAIAKIYSSIAKKEFENEFMVINRYPLSMPEEEIENRYNTINTCINKKRVLKMKYVSLKNKEKEYMFHPYDLFMYNNAWFVIGWCEEFHEISYFKLNRITEFEETSKLFTKHKFYNKADYIDVHGFKNNGEWHHIEFVAYNNYASLVKERVYGKNQEVIPIDSYSTLVKVDMQNKENIIVFILGFGRNVYVQEPKWLQDEIKNISLDVVSKYE